MTASVVCWRAACAAWGEPARPGFPRGETGKGRSDSLRRRLFLWDPCFAPDLPSLSQSGSRAVGFYFQSRRARTPLRDPDKHLLFGALHFDGGFGIGLRFGQSSEFRHADTGPQVALALWRPAEYLEWCGPVSINAATLAIGLFDDLWNGAGPVEVDVGIQILPMKAIHRLGMLRTDVSETYVFANDRSVFRFDQAVVPRSIRA
jgi:hypothetical protein